MIRATGLATQLGRHWVLQDLDFTVQPGERIALLGLNGAGKTTLLRCLLGLVPFRGELWVGDRNVRSASRDARALIGYVPQRAPHFSGTLGEVVEFLTRLRQADSAMVHEKLAALGLSMDDHGHKALHTISGGMLQKVLLALALGERNPLLLLDEPTANLDPRARREFLRVVANADPQTTIMLASHRLADVEAVTDRLLVLHQGRIVFDGDRTDLRERLGALSVLWIKVPADRRSHAEAWLHSRRQLPPVLANGTAVGVRVDQTARIGILVGLREAGIPVEDFWVDSPSLHEILEHVLGEDSSTHGTAVTNGLTEP
jgi:ABC-type multidrug transport system ATPase subunit